LTRETGMGRTIPAAQGITGRIITTIITDRRAARITGMATMRAGMGTVAGMATEAGMQGATGAETGAVMAAAMAGATVTRIDAGRREGLRVRGAR